MNKADDIKITELKLLRSIEHFKSVISMAELALKTTLLINGGAAIAVLTFVGNTQTSNKSIVACGLHAFALGVLAGALATFCAYLTQNRYMNQINIGESLDENDVRKKAAIFCCGLSYVCFFVGIFLVSGGLFEHGT